MITYICRKAIEMVFDFPDILDPSCTSAFFQYASGTGVGGGCMSEKDGKWSIDKEAFIAIFTNAA